jgi:hypothetical protein
MENLLPVRVWIARRASSVSLEKFAQTLRETFAPVTVQLMSKLGLSHYLPTLFPEIKPDGLPDEVALVQYSSREIYSDAKKTTAGRLYALSHGVLFEKIYSDFPKLYTGTELDTVTIKAAYYYPDITPDWNKGEVIVFACYWATAQVSDDWVKNLGLPVISNLKEIQHWIVWSDGNLLLAWINVDGNSDNENFTNELTQAMGKLADNPQLIFAHKARDEWVKQCAFEPSNGVAFSLDETLRVRW